VGGVANGATATLTLTATVDAGTGGTTITNTATLTAVDQADSTSTNDSDSVDINVISSIVDLSVIKTVDDGTPHEGDTINYTIEVTNSGPGNATGVEVTDQLPSGVTYVSDTPSQGSYASGTGLWTVGGVANAASVTLVLTATVDAGTRGSTITNTAAITTVDQGDPNSSNNVNQVEIEVRPYPVDAIVVTAAQASRSLLPGASLNEVFHLELVNFSTEAETLSTVVLHNASSGPGTPAQLDEDWQDVELAGRISNRLAEQMGGSGPGPLLVSSGRFAGGEARFSNLSLAIAPDDTASLVFRGGASLVARDGDVLDITIDGPPDLVFTRAVTLSGEWPASPAGSFPVDGMAAAQITLNAVTTSSFLTGSLRNLALDLMVPANGYEDDVLERLNVVNLGTALFETDILAVEAWVDDGDAAFDPDLDRPLGGMTFTGNRWELTGLAEPVAVGGLRVFVSCDLAELATEGRTIQFALPAAPEDAIGMVSGNDGPIDVAVENPFVQSLSAADRVALTANPIAPGSARPGEVDVQLLHLILANTYAVTQTLEALHVSNLTTGGGSAAELDGEVKLLSLRADGDGNGQLGDLVDDPLIGTAFFIDGEATFTGLSWRLDAGLSGQLFVTGEIALLEAADGDVVGVEAPGAEALSFADNPSVVASWPVDSGARWTIDGMVAEQISNVGAPVATLGPNEGPALALDLLLPRNGYASDLLQGIRLENQGTAVVGDLAEVRLWQDGSNGGFDAGAGDDVDLGPMSGSQGEWSSLLSLPLAQVGTRLFVSVTASATPTDSATVQLAVPVDGITVDSGNDGPIDVAVENPNPLLLSTSALLTTLELDPSASILGQTVTASLTVRNVSGIQITDITPSPLTAMGDGTLQLLTGPLPATFSLDPSAEDSFVWTYEAMSAGEVRLSGSASGFEFGSGQPRQSLTSESNTHRVFLEAQDISLFPVESMPFAINRGQSDVVPISLTFTNEGGEGASDVEILGLRIRVEEESGGGIVPADVLSRVVVNEGTSVYLEKTSLETAGSIVELPLIQPIIVEAGAEASSQVTVSLSLDISSTTTVPNFRLTMADSTWVTASDATSGGPVEVLLQEGAYPIASGLARIVTEATELVVDGSPGGARTAGRGQDEVELLTLDLLNPDPAGLASDVRVISFGVKLVDSLGSVVGRPGDYLERIRVRDPLQQYANQSVGEDSTLTLSLTPLLSVPVNTPLALTLTGDISSTAQLGSFRLRLAAAGSFDARDANSGDPVTVTYVPDPAPVEGGLVTVEAVAESLLALGTAHLPPVLTVGVAGVEAMEVYGEDPLREAELPIRRPGQRAAGSGQLPGSGRGAARSVRDRAGDRLRPERQHGDRSAQRLPARSRGYLVDHASDRPRAGRSHDLLRDDTGRG
jgi:uncharacterized repeat protein (TIGR01451 family)